jgi:hypothetical protein
MALENAPCPDFCTVSVTGISSAFADQRKSAKISG